VFSYHQKFNPEEIQEIESGCKSGALGCVDCKLKCTKKINKFLAPVIEIRKKYENNIDEVKEILHTGEEKARNVASTTMQEVREAMKLG
jgi:tryptophanyl-tRNA synthetase